MNFKLIGILIVSCIVNIYADVYCDEELCYRGRHIACGNSGKFAAGCNGHMVDLKPYISMIVDQHNSARNLIAGGDLPGFPPAIQMATMRWDQELAQMAAFNVLQCEMKHDDCRNTYRFRFSGQNLANMQTVLPRVDIGGFLNVSMQEWFQEYRHANRNDVELYVHNPNRTEDIGHFTVMVNERNTHIGCALARYPTWSVGNLLLACNYAVTNMIENPVYRFGPTASQCRSDRNPKYNNLCSLREAYRHNEWIG